MSRSIAEVWAWAHTAVSGGLASFVPPPLPLPDPCNRQPRIPHKIHDRITPNSLHPLILAPDRFTKWLTPYHIAKMDQASWLFLAQTIVRHCLTMANWILPSTLTNYTLGLICFTKFFKDFQVPEADHMPASETILSMFISTWAAGSVSKGTMKTWIEGLCLWHVINDTPWNSNSVLRCTIKVGINTWGQCFSYV